MGNNFVLLTGKKNVERRLWVARVLLLLKMIAKSEREAEEFAFLQYMEYMTCWIVEMPFWGAFECDRAQMTRCIILLSV